MKYILLFILFIFFYLIGTAQTATVTSVNVTCFGSNNGSVDIINPSGGIGPYEYSIDGKFSWFPTGSFPNLIASTYDIWIRDALLTEVQLDPARVLTEPPIMSATPASVDVTVCNGNNNGSITINASAGGSGNYEYSINGAVSWQSSSIFANQLAGTYDVRIRDANATACSITLNAALVLSQPVILSATVGSTNVTCFNAADGIINITLPTGGGGTYQYSNNGGTSWQAGGTFNSLSAGMYNVKIRDAANTTCSITLDGSRTITQPNILAATIAPVNVTVCNGNNNGSITINGATGGGGTFEYSINGGIDWQASNSFLNLTAGTYDIKIRDFAAPACIITLNASQTISQPAVISGTVSKTDVSCFGSGDGTITVTAAGGGGTYEYTINGGGAWQASNSFTLLAAGTNDIRIRDLANPTCVASIDAAYLINQPAVLNATVTPTNVTICNGNNNGSIVMSAPVGGSLNYQYTINGGANWQSSLSFTNLTAATYDVRIRDANATACSITLNAALVLSQPAILSATVSSTNVTCFNAADGIINITLPTGGGGTYQYSNNGGASWQAGGAFNSLNAGMYNVKIRDAANTTCSITLDGSRTITQPNILAATIATADVTVCNGNNNGSITINGASGGSGGYQYSINGGSGWQIFNSFINLTAGFYDIKIRDFAAPACIITLNAAQTISQPAVLSGTISKTDVSCFGSNDGTITIDAIGGSGAWEYSIDSGFSWQTTNIFTNLIALSYDIFVRDFANPTCILSLNSSFTILQPAILNGTINAINGSICNGSNNGSITINGSAGGNGTFNYSIDGGVNWQSSNSFTGLAAGNYNVQIRDAVAQACVITLNAAQAITQPASLNAILNKTDINCFNNLTGIVSITFPTGGSGSYEYTINGGTDWFSNGTFNGLSTGVYNVIMRDSSNVSCTKTLNGFYTITQPNILAASITPVDVSICNGNNNGSITINGASGGSGGYQYSINGGLGWQASNSFTLLGAGTNDVRIRDAAATNCVITLNAALVITQPTILSGAISKTDVSCFGSSNGTLTVTATGGGGTYEYTINGGGAWQASNSFTLLAAGTNDIRIRDFANPTCVAVINAAYTINQPAVLNATVTPANVTICNGNNNGSIVMSAPVGGSLNYQYTINGGTNWQNDSSFTGLTAGNYIVQIRDADAQTCVITLNAIQVITQPATLIATLNKTDINCYNYLTGVISITFPTGGSGNYEYSINGGTDWFSNSTFDSLNAGMYNVKIRDSLNPTCIITLNGSLTILQPDILAATIVPTNVTACYGYNNGNISIIGAAGGNGTYEYSINGITWQSSNNFPNLFAGSYDVRIRDASVPFCSITLNSAVIISQPVLLSASVNSTNISCNGANDGSITISSPAGGYGTYEYSIDSGLNWQLPSTFNSLSPGTNNVQIRDSANQTCVIALNPALTITQPTSLNTSITYTEISCTGFSNGTATISANGGVTPYSYLWDDATPQTTQTASNLSANSYNCTVTDDNGCTIVGSITIPDPLLFSVSVSLARALKCNNDSDAVIVVTETNGLSPYIYSWDDYLLQTTQSADSLPAGTYSVSVTDTKGCFTTNSFTIIAPIDSIVWIDTLTTYTFSSNDTINHYLSGNPSGGGFSGNGIVPSNSFFDAQIAGVGNWPITYTYITFTNCVITDVDTVHVINVVGTITGISDTVFYCYGDTSIDMFGHPEPDTTAIGWFDTTDVYAVYIQNLGNNHGIFNPTAAGQGTHLVKFQYIYNSATLEVLMNVKVDSVGEISITNIDTAYCFSNDAITVNASAQFLLTGAGIWSGLPFNFQSTSAATFNVDSAGVGNDTVFYTYTALSQCTKQINFPFVVNPLPVDSFISLDQICRNGNPIELKGLQETNPDIVTDFFQVNTSSFSEDLIFIDPANINLGSNFIAYQFSDTITTCKNSWVDTLFVNQVATLDILDDETKYCTNNSIDTLTGTFTYNNIDFYVGGIFSGVGVISTGNGTGIINPATIPFDSLSTDERQYNDTIFLNFTDLNGCSVEKSVHVKIYGLPDINIVGISQKSQCVNHADSALNINVFQPILGSYLFTIFNSPVSNFFIPSDYTDTLNNTTTQSYIDVPIHLIFTATNSSCITDVYDTVVIHKLPDVDFNIVSNKCIADTIKFSGISTIDSISVWSWNFGDGALIQNDSMPTHNFISGGDKNIKLTLTSKYGCVNFKDSIIYFDSVPSAQFTWKNECFGGPVVFINNSFGDTITNYLWNFGDNFTDTLQNPLHQYSAEGSYGITLTITTKNSCVNSITQTALIRPEIGNYPYFENFDNSSGAWSSESLNNKNSWRYGQSLTNNIPPLYQGSNAWVTSYRADSAYQNNELSYVISPCFNFDSLIRPMIKMKIHYSLQNGLDGVSLQYSLDNDSTWLTLGALDDGINWYNSYTISSNPGGQSLGWTDTLNAWIDVRHDLDILAGKPNVRFRIAFASLIGNIYNGIAFDDIWIGERSKKILYEHFTNANVLGCLGWDIEFNKWVDADKRDVVDIQYHTSSPAPDRLNTDNPDYPSARSFLYGDNPVPYSVMDGDFHYQTYDWSLNNYRTNFIKRRLADPKFNITLTKSISASTVSITASVQSATFIGNATLQIAVLEKKIERTDVGNNGETIFRSVLKKMLPDAGGSYNLVNWSPGLTKDTIFPCSLSGFYNTSDSNNIVIVAFIQDNFTKEVYQAATTDTSMGIIYVDPVTIGDSPDFVVYPNPSDGNINIRFNYPIQENTTLQIFNSIGELTYTKDISKGFTEQNIDMGKNSTGIYFIRLLSGNRVIGNKKITIAR